jgi:hypothetical protein
MVYNMTDAIWSRIRKPTDNEIKWLKQLRGAQHTDKLGRKTYDERQEFLLRVKNRKWISEKAKKVVIEYNDEIKGYVTDLKNEHDETIRKYQFLCDELLELIYPEFLQQLK